MADFYAEAHNAKAKADNREAATQELARHKAEVAKCTLDRMKQPFNDVPVYKPRHAFLRGPT